MGRQSFEQYRDAYFARMSDIPVHNDSLTVLDWLKDKPGHETDITEIASVLAGGVQPSDDYIRRAIGVSLVLTSWPEAIGEIFFEIRSDDGQAYAVERVPQPALDGDVPYVLEATGEVIKNLPSRLIPRIRVADFEPSADTALEMRS